MTITEQKRARAKHQPVGRWIRAVKRLALYIRDHFKCWICCKRISGHDPRAISLDHLRAKCKGGSNHESNLLTAHMECNAKRAAEPGLKIGRIDRPTDAPLAPFLAIARKLMEGRTWDQAVRAAGRMCREGL